MKISILEKMLDPHAIYTHEELDEITPQWCLGLESTHGEHLISSDLLFQLLNYKPDILFGDYLSYLDQEIRTAMEQDATQDYQDFLFQKCLKIACEQGHLPLLELMMSNLNKKNAAKPLIVDAEDSDEDNNNFSSDEDDNDNTKILIDGIHSAAHIGQLDVAELLLDELKKISDTEWRETLSTAIYFALHGEYPDFARILIAKHKVIDKKHLMAAAEHGYSDIVKNILEAGIVSDLQSIFNQILATEVAKKKIDIEEYYKKQGDLTQFIMNYPEENGFITALKLFLEDGCLASIYSVLPYIQLDNFDIDSFLKDKKFFESGCASTILAKSAAAGNFALVEKFLQKEYRAFLKSYDYYDALKKAAECGHYKVVEIFLENDVISREDKIRFTRSIHEEWSLTNEFIKKASADKYEKIFNLLKPYGYINKTPISFYNSNQDDENEKTIIDAISEGDMEWLKEYLSNNLFQAREAAISFTVGFGKNHIIDLINFFSSYGCKIQDSDLIEAIQWLDINIVKVIIDKRIQSEKTDNNNESEALPKQIINLMKILLSAALEKGKFDVAAYLLEKLRRSSVLSDDQEITAIRNVFDQAMERSEQWGISLENYFNQIFCNSPSINETRWHKINVDHKIFTKLSPYGFSLQVFDKLLPLMKLASIFEHTQDYEFYTYLLAVLFDDAKEAIAYLKLYQSKHRDSLHPVHDACQFELPATGMWDIPIWRNIVMRYGKKGRNLLAYASKIEEKISGATIPIEVLEPHIRKKIIAERKEYIIKKAAQQYDEETEAAITMTAIRIIEGKIKRKLENNEADNQLVVAERNRQLKKREDGREQYIKTQISQQINNHVQKKLRKFVLNVLKKENPEIGNLSPTEQSKLADAEINKRQITRMGFKQIVDMALSISFQRASEFPVFARECLLLGVSENSFNSALDIFQSDLKLRDNLPPLFVDGKLINESNYYFAKLPKDDPRGLILGKYTNCCQSIGGNGAAVAAHGFQSEDGGFYVVMKKGERGILDPYHDEIVAQSWAWISEAGNLVFDSIELRHPSKGESYLKFYEFAAEQALGWKIKPKKQVEKTHYSLWNVNNRRGNESPTEKIITRVMLGKGGQTPKNLSFETAQVPEIFIGTRLYGDSDSQWVLKERPELAEQMDDQNSLGLRLK